MRDVVLASFLNPESILDKGGLALLALIVFAETGLLIGFFLPGDSLLFVSRLPGLRRRRATASRAAGRAAGGVRRRRRRRPGRLLVRPQGRAGLFSRPDSRFFKQQNVAKAHAFFERHGAKTIVLARFVPDRAHVRPDRGRASAT